MQGDSHRAAETGLHEVPDDLPGGSADAASQPRHCWRGPARPRNAQQIFDHLPLYRQSRIYAREGVEIDRSTMAGWVEQVHELLEPLLAALGRYVLAAQKVHADDTPGESAGPRRGKDAHWAAVGVRAR